MTGTAALLARVRALGVKVRISGDNLALRPIAAVPDSLKAALTVAKPEILALLQAETTRSMPQPLAAASRGPETSQQKSLSLTDFRSAETTGTTTAGAVAQQGAGYRQPASQRLGEAQHPGQRGKELLPAWAGAKHMPIHGSDCTNCRGSRWWRERDLPKGWRCRTCHPPPPGLAVSELHT